MDQALNFKELVLWGLGGTTMILGYFLRGAMDEVKEHRTELATLHERYVKKDDFKEFKEELFTKLDELKAQIKEK